MSNVGKPEGKEGEATLERMNREHTSVSLWALEHIPIKENDIVLDVGCGGGINVKRLHDLSPENKTYGIDYSKTSVDMSTDLNQKLVDSGDIIIKEADVQDLPFDDNYFNVITAFETVYFWPNVIDSFREVKRVLRPDGLFAIILTANGYYDEHVRKISEEVGCNFYNDIELREMLESAGFSSIKIIIRQFEKKEELVKTIKGNDYSEEVFEDTFIDDDSTDGHHESPEWLCIIAKI